MADARRCPVTIGHPVARTAWWRDLLAGCWQITGRVGRAALTFVTFVIKGHCDIGAAPGRCVADRAR